ncbi:rhomboid family intramembrane serine protease [Uniformispora flossi]|uniref:rhomboid family intramembrane serine protease n=1 Tax=Uniformispora flossi TaxID=3390723 RepID=UPI003C2EE272
MNPLDGDRPAGPAEGPAGSPTCYRHPGRETHIRCARCERPVCSECMVSASVGFQCPECVRDGRRTVRQARTIAGGSVRSPQKSAIVTKVLIGLNLAVFLLVLVVGDKVVDKLMLIGRALVGNHVVGVAEGDWYRLLTAGFLHQEVWHIAFNMWALWMLGPALESALGRTRFLAVYLLSLLGGTATSYLLAAQNQGSLGASGAVFGLFGAAIVVGRRMRYDLRPLIALLVINLVITFLNTSRIDWRAHVGGLVVGVISAIVMVHAPRAHRVVVQVAGVLVIAAAIVATVLVRTSQLT